MTRRDERQEPVSDELDDDIHDVPSHTPDFRTELAEELSRLVPEALADGKIDVEKLRELLSEDVADDGREGFGLVWPGKSRALKAAQAPTTATLVPDREASKDWDTTANVFIEGDNLEVLKILQKHYHGKIKMIYIDPPYNTGNDFIYPDNYKEGLQTYLEWTKQVSEDGKKLSSNPESAGRYHSNWLNMMYPRLKLARNLLSEDGLIFVSIDDNEIDNLMKICKEIFGEQNFVNTVIWHYGKMSNEQNKLANNHEYVLVFRKSPSGGIFSRIKKEDSEYRNRYLRFVNEDNKVLYGPVRNSTDNLVLGRVKKVKEALGKTDLEDHDVLFDFNVEFKAHSDTIYVSTIKGNSGEKVKVFDTGQKPLGLLQLLLKFGAADPGALVLDFFSGSGSTAHAVMSLNAQDGGARAHIQVQLPEPVDFDSEAARGGFTTIADIARDRIRRTGQKISEELGDQLSARETPLDVGFRAYKLSDTSFVKWRETSAAEQNALEQRLAGLRGSADDDATPEMLLTELLLKQGYSLTESVSELEIAGLKVWSVADGALLAVMDEHVKPSLEQLRAVVEAGAVRLVILEDVLAGDDQLKTNLVQHAKTHGVELWSA